MKTEAPAEAGTTATETQDTPEAGHRLRMALLRRNRELPESAVRWAPLQRGRAMSAHPLFPDDDPLSDEELAAIQRLSEEGLVDLPAAEVPWSPESGKSATPLQTSLEPDRFSPAPLDYRRLITEGLPEERYLDRLRCVPAGVSVWVAGPAGSAKSIFALWTGCQLSRAGVGVVYISQENPVAVELRRLERLEPDPEHLKVYHYQAVDLADPEHVEWVKWIGAGAGLIVFDTFTACWSGDENDNAQVAGFDREVVRPIIDATGASVLTLDHTGHPTAFVPRKGVNAARGASSKGQKADVFLEFRDQGDHRFLIRQGKNRVTGSNEPDRTFEVVDTEDDMLDIVQVENTEDEKIRETAEAMVAYITAATSPPSTNELRAAMKGVAGKEIQTQAMNALRLEDPRRVQDVSGHIDTDKGRRRAKVWTVAPPELADE